jgi:ribonucleoside-diphosphate reductase alpha chain
MTSWMATIPPFDLDPKIVAFEKHVYDTPLIQDVLRDKYLQKDEKHPNDMFGRVAKSIASSPCEDNPEIAQQIFYNMMSKRLFLPGGRILAGAGTAKRVTLMNCYVNGTLEDSIEGIADGKKRLMVTSSMGGGMGTDFSPLRPHNALIERLGTGSSGAVSFMDTFDSDGKTIRSAGERRAAQMGTLNDTHPDLIRFITSKGDALRDGKDRLKEFNISVWASNAFKAAVDDDEDWNLFFHIPPSKPRPPELIALDFEDEDGVQQYVYSTHKARDLWKLITDYTYEYSDPGIIFGDRVNELNNLAYCEKISCTNPCGEQPLPPNGACNLGAINVANFVRNPFTRDASLDFEMLAIVAKWGIRFLDNVIDVTAYPLEEQRQEQINKRRVGLGITGLGTCFSEMCLKYGSPGSVQLARQIMKTIAISAYEASIDLGEVRGNFGLFEDRIIDYGFIAARLDDDLKEAIVTRGLRNGVLLTIAPVGTGSIAIGNPSSGLEPDFSLAIERAVRQNNTEEFKKYTEVVYTKRFYQFCTGNNDTPEYMKTAYELDILDHIKVQGALQEWVDASTSKTINIPEDMPKEKFLEVYDLAYQYGLKGCTTYRHSKYRQSILKEASKGDTPQLPPVTRRPESLEGKTYKLKWPSMTASMYITINYQNNKPYEIFFASKDAKFQDWMTALTLMISMHLRSGADPAIVVRDLKQVVSTHDTFWDRGKFYGSLPARIASIIEDDFINHGILPATAIATKQAAQTKPVKEIPTGIFKDLCPSCRSPSLVHKEGCKACESCGYSQC